MSATKVASRSASGSRTTPFGAAGTRSWISARAFRIGFCTMVGSPFPKSRAIGTIRIFGFASSSCRTVMVSSFFPSASEETLHA